ncbi:MAG: hypothetical protein K2N52_02880, partial [Clostridia bacterium]|nr:hypothetical protein [Clostridia bacterium]
YQEEDSKLLKIEQDAQASEEWKNFSQAKSFLTKAPEKLDNLDAKARELHAALDLLNKKYAEIEETLKDFENLDELVEEGADISFYKKNATQIAEKLKAIKAEVNALSKTIKDADDEYKAMKKKTIAMQKQYQESSAVYKEYKETKLKEMNAVKKELDKLAEKLDPEILKKYQMKRSERIFPIICAVKNDRCPKCGIELSILGKEKVSRGGVTECDNCHRFLYQE